MQCYSVFFHKKYICWLILNYTPKLNDNNNLYEAAFEKKDDYKIDYTNYDDGTFNLTSEYENKYSVEAPIVRLMKPQSSNAEPEANIVDTNNESFTY